MNAEKLLNDVFLLSNLHTNNDFHIGYQVLLVSCVVEENGWDRLQYLSTGGAMVELLLVEGHPEFLLIRLSGYTVSR
jgi:hypothetical protein